MSALYKTSLVKFL